MDIFSVEKQFDEATARHLLFLNLSPSTDGIMYIFTNQIETRRTGFHCKKLVEFEGGMGDIS